MHSIMTTADTNIIFYAFRYALGRKTGAVSEVVMYILNHWRQIPEKYKQQMKDEINHAINMGIAGMVCDIAEWNKILFKS